MRYIPLENVQPGMVLGYEIFDDAGHILIPKGVMLTEAYINRLAKFNFDGIYVDDFLSNEIVIEPVISPELRAESMECIKNGDIDGCMGAAVRIVNEILAKDVISFDLMDIRTADNYTYAHSVNVAVLSCIVGMGMDLKEDDLVNLAIAGLLHDIGKAKLPQDILNKPTRLTKEEFEIVKSHPMLSHQIIASRLDIDDDVKLAIMSHHENIDGSGYPNHAEGHQLNLYSKILRVADNYDALISKRPYKEAYYPLDAAEYLMGGGGFLFDQDIVEVFLRYVPFYAKGTEVMLSNGMFGIIADNTGEHNLRPVIQLFSGTLVDLNEPKNMNITIGIPDNEREQRLLESERERSDMVGDVGKYKATVNKPCVVAVDDMLTNLQALRTILQDECEVVLLKSGRQAISYFEKMDSKYPDLVLMDINMPDVDGINAASEIIKITGNEVPIVFVSAVRDRDTVLKCRELDAAGYIARPYKPGYVKSEVKRILSGR
ncbi:MAG: response regulator [Lachnospiraceae bacterium]|nr:response regulator [Lachnospiraceae bacterium]